MNARKSNPVHFTLVASEETVDAVYDATISIVGHLLRPNSGIFIVLPVFKAFGLRNL